MPSDRLLMQSGMQEAQQVVQAEVKGNLILADELGKVVAVLAVRLKLHSKNRGCQKEPS